MIGAYDGFNVFTNVLSTCSQTNEITCYIDNESDENRDREEEKLAAWLEQLQEKEYMPMLSLYLNNQLRYKHGVVVEIEEKEEAEEQEEAEGQEEAEEQEETVKSREKAKKAKKQQQYGFVF